MKKENIKLIGNLFLFLIALLTGAAGGVMMAAAIALPDGGATAASGSDGEGALTLGKGRDASSDLYLSDIDKRITKIRPMATPIDQISRYSKTESTKSMIVKYYSLGTKPIKTTLKTAITAQSSGLTCAIVPTDGSLFDIDDTIRVVGVKGYRQSGDAQVQAQEDLVLCVSGVDSNTSNPVVFAVNGKNDSNKNPILLPAIPEGTTLIRMGKACAELDAQTSSFSNVPTAEVQYCQNFMMQVEEGTFEKMSLKEVDWNFSDLEEDSVFDMRLGQENSFLFGAKGMMKHPIKKSQEVYFTGGIYWQAGKDLEVGIIDQTTKEAVITDDELVNITKELFTGVGVGNKRKILFAGSNLLAAFSKVKSEKFRLKESVENWNLKFKSFDTDFGEVLVIHHELFDVNNMPDCGLCMDPNFLTKRSFLPLDRSALNLKDLGVRNSKAIVLQEVSCLYLRYSKAHARIRLNKSVA